MKNETLIKYMLIVFILSSFIGLKAQSRKVHKADPYRVDNTKPIVPQGMKLVWHDEFNNNGKPDPKNWVYEYGFVRNRELQWYQPQNAFCKDGRLIIEARREKTDNPNYNPMNGDWRSNREFAEYTSACIKTIGLQEITGEGYFEFRARIDTSMGSWPAIWLLGKNERWPFCGEIDVMEFYRIQNEPYILANVAWGSEQVYNGEWDSEKHELKKFLDADPDWVKKYHIWSMSWDESHIKIFLDGELLNEIDLEKTINPDGNNPFESDKKFYILLNLAIGSNGGDPSGVKFPLSYEVDYVRVYQKI